MRIRFFVLLALAFAVPVGFAACAPETVGPPPPAPTGSFLPPAPPDAGTNVATASERALADVYLTSLSSGPEGLALLGPHLDDDVHFGFPGVSDARGKAATMHARDLIFEPFEPRLVRPRRVLRSSSAQAVEWWMTGTQARPWMGIAETGQRVRIPGISLLFTKDDGSITDLRVYFDIAVVKTQLGSGPKGLAAALAQRVPDGGAADAAPAASAPSSSAPAENLPAVILDATDSAGEKTNVEIVRGTLDALEAGNLAAYEGAMADDVEITTMSRPFPIRGKPDVRTYYKAMRHSIGQLDTTVLNAWGVSQFVVVEYTIAGEQLGPVVWVPAQPDKAIRLHVVDVSEIVGGKIAHVWRYDNPGEIIADAAP